MHAVYSVDTDADSRYRRALQQQSCNADYHYLRENETSAASTASSTSVTASLTTGDVADPLPVKLGSSARADKSRKS